MKTIKTISLALISILLFATAGCGEEDPIEEFCKDNIHLSLEIINKCTNQPFVGETERENEQIKAFILQKIGECMLEQSAHEKKCSEGLCSDEDIKNDLKTKKCIACIRDHKKDICNADAQCKEECGLLQN